MEENRELGLAWELVERTGVHVFLTGKAGTGKTTFLKRLRDEGTKRMVVLAPTGIAAINAGGMTLHSFSSCLSHHIFLIHRLLPAAELRRQGISVSAARRRTSSGAWTCW